MVWRNQKLSSLPLRIYRLEYMGVVYSKKCSVIIHGVHYHSKKYSMGLDGEHSDTNCTDLLLYLMCVISDKSVMGDIFSFHLCPLDEVVYISISLMDIFPCQEE